jgi:hypothetical protein
MAEAVFRGTVINTVYIYIMASLINLSIRQFRAKAAILCPACFNFKLETGISLTRLFLESAVLSTHFFLISSAIT